MTHTESTDLQLEKKYLLWAIKDSTLEPEGSVRLLELALRLVDICIEIGRNTRKLPHSGLDSEYRLNYDEEIVRQ